MLYSFGDVPLPRGVNANGALWFSVSLVVLLLTGGRPFLFLGNPVFIYGGIPFVIAFVFSRPMFEGRRPDKFFGAALSFLSGPKHIYAGQRVELGRHKSKFNITAVRRYTADGKNPMSD